MTNKLLGIIAVNLTIITGLMVLQSIPTYQHLSDPTLKNRIQKIAICDPRDRKCASVEDYGFGTWVLRAH